MKQLEGVMDGVSLGLLIPGVVYDISVSLGAWLVCQGVAEEEVSLIVPVILPSDGPPLATGGVTVTSSRDRKNGGKS